MKEFNKENVIDLLDDCPEEISSKFLENSEHHNQSYTYVIVQKEDVLSTWLLEQGYPERERVLVKISW